MDPHPQSRHSLILSRGDVAGLMTPSDWLAAAQVAFLAAREGGISAPPPLHLPVFGGGFHAKGAVETGGAPLAVLKLNGNFPGNPGRGLPTIQGVIILCDAACGTVLAVMDSIEVTLRRTAAASALAARHLALPGPLTVCGCGDQARAQVAALVEVVEVERIYAWDIDGERAEAFAAGLRAQGHIAEAALDLSPVAWKSTLIVTCTTASEAFLEPRDVSPGAFIAAVGADSPEKWEISPALMARAAVVADSVSQCLIMGDLHHAVAAGVMTVDDVHGELAQVVSGERPGRTSADQIFVFDSTGTAALDLTAAAAILAAARRAEVGVRLHF